MRAQGGMETQDVNVGDAESPEKPGDLPAKAAARGRPGPKTPEGKSRVRLNPLRHGLCATTPVIPGVERVEDWEAHRAGVLENLAPVGHLETVLAERVALLLWRLNRVAAYERAELAEAHNQPDDGEGRDHLLPDHKLDKLIRYEAHLNRQLCQIMHELEALQDRRHGQRTPLARLDVHGLPETS